MAAQHRLHQTRARRRLSQVVGAGAVALALGTRSTWLEAGWAPLVLAWAGLLLVVAGVFGRLLSTLYIGGRKSSEIVTAGPYGLTRNPLYFFSFLGLLGIGLGSANPAVLAVLVLAFALYYPGVFAQEEAKLLRKHGEPFAAYQQRVPRFWPRLGGSWEEPDWVEASPRELRSALGDAFWFIAAYIALRAIAEAHARGLLPAYPLPF
ncbi:MAG TPA: isoprenylcysteine carboxylmethyltransferase family protein [Gammaproteobacteria bacterium]|nr:isoprenylcysteine carboxylmethyltransferase family protein [Gammaproteobacteria bacterium]